MQQLREIDVTELVEVFTWWLNLFNQMSKMIFVYKPCAPPPLAICTGTCGATNIITNFFLR